MLRMSKFVFNTFLMRILFFIFISIIIFLFSYFSFISPYVSLDLIYPSENANVSIHQTINLTFNVSCYETSCNEVSLGLGIKNISSLYSANGVRGIDIYQLYDGELNPTNNFNVEEYALSIWSNENYIYAATGGNGISVFRINEIGGLEFLDNDYQGGYSTSVFGCNDYIYLADSSRGLDVYSMNESGLNHLYNDYFDAGSGYGVWCDQNYIYLANGLRGIDVYSMNESGLTYLFGDHQENGSAVFVTGDGEYIYVADEYRGLDVYSMNESGLNHLYNDYLEGGYALSIWRDENYIYLANSLRGIDVYSMNESGLTHLYNIPSRAENSEAYFIIGDGEYIYLADGDNGLEMYSIGDMSLEHVYHDYQGGYSSSLLKKNQGGILSSFFARPFLIQGEENFLINLTENESMIISFQLNASGEIDESLELFGYSYLYSNYSSLNVSSEILLKIVNNIVSEENESLEETPQEECSDCDGDDGGSGGGGGGGSNIKQKNNTLNECVYDINFDWGCSEWTTCINQRQTRTCNKFNNCGKLEGRPVTKQVCGIEIDLTKALFDIDVVTISDSLMIGENLSLIISLINVGRPGGVNATTNYIIKDRSGKVVYEGTETDQIETQSEFIKEIDTSRLKSGEYSVFVELSYLGQTEPAQSETAFRINSLDIPSSKNGRILNYIVIILVVLLFLWIVKLTILKKLFSFNNELNYDLKNNK